jgi:glutathione S-transferase
MTVSIRYFEAQGRAQALRHALADSGEKFEDIRVAMSDWPKHKEDAGFAGWFASLPTLTWGDDTIAETIPIASYVAKRLGHYDGLSAREIARLEAVVSSIYIDVQLRFTDLLYADVAYPGADVAAAVPRTINRAIDKLARIAELLRPSGWLSGERPTVADFFFAEGTELVLRFTSEEVLGAKAPRALEHATRIRARPAIAREWRRRPSNFTARPDERSVLERIRAVPLA